MLFSNELIDSLPSDPIGGAIRVCDRIFEVLPQDSRNWDENDYEVLMEGYALLLGMKDASLIDIPFFQFDSNPSASIRDDSFRLHNLICEVRAACVAASAQQKFQQQKAHYGARLGAGFVYEFTQGDLDRVQELLGQLRELIRDSVQFTEEHRRRLLLKLEKLQTEIHKKMSSLDRLWGITGELGVVLGKFGKDAKPLVDRFKEIMEITWRTQSRAEDMPSDSPPPLANDGKPLLSDTAD